MKHTLRLGILLTLLMAATIPVRTDSTPAVNGFVSGIELCEQAVCGSAIFVGFYQGQFGVRPNALGTIAVAVNHDTPLPTAPNCVFITGGHWAMQVGFRQIGGETHGQLCANLLPANTFTVLVNLSVAGGSTPLHFVGTLNHNVFPPTIQGLLTN